MTHSNLIIIDKHAFRCELISGFFSRLIDEEEVSILQFSYVDELLDRKDLIDEIGDSAAITLSIGGASLSDNSIIKELVELKKVLGHCPLIIMADDTSELQVRLASEFGVSGLISTAMPPAEVIATCEFILRGGKYLPNGHSHWHLRQPARDDKLPSINKVGHHVGSRRINDCEDVRVLDAQFEPVSSPINMGQSPQGFKSAAPGQQPPPVGKLPKLTERQSEVIRGLMLGLSNKEIARELDLSDATVKVHIRNLMKKLGAANRTQLALIGAKFAENTTRAP